MRIEKSKLFNFIQSGDKATRKLTITVPLLLSMSIAHKINLTLWFVLLHGHNIQNRPQPKLKSQGLPNVRKAAVSILTQIYQFLLDMG